MPTTYCLCKSGKIGFGVRVRVSISVIGLIVDVRHVVKTKHLAVIRHSATRSLLTPRGTFRRRVIVYDLKLHNIIRLRHAINDFDWTDLLSSSQDVSVVYSLFISSITQLINHCVPAKTVKVVSLTALLKSYGLQSLVKANAMVILR